MARRLAAGAIALGALLHILLIGLLALTDGALYAGPTLMLGAAFLLALLALGASIWVFFSAPAEATLVAAFEIACHACGHPADAQCAFCTRCGESASY